MSGGFHRAVREKLLGRVAIDGPSGAGKSVSGLILAHQLAKSTNGKVAAIDTEHRSLSKYVGETFSGITFDFDVNDDLADARDFSPDSYTAAITKAGKAGYRVLFIDSLSHAWSGEGGALEIKDKKGSSYYDWKDVTPMHNKMVNAILSYPGHVICAMRSKTDYSVEVDPQTGKKSIKKIGTAPIQRHGMEYEFDLYGSMEHDTHQLVVTKSRCRAMDGLKCMKPGPDFWEPFIAWLESGVAPAPPPPKKEDAPYIRKLRFLIKLKGMPVSVVAGALAKYGDGATKIDNLSESAAEVMSDRIIAVLKGEEVEKFMAWMAASMQGSPVGLPFVSPTPPPAASEPPSPAAGSSVETAGAVETVASETVTTAETVAVAETV